MKVMLAKKHDGQDPAGWWMSEKLDGVRAVWNGENFVSRNGKTFNVPEWFTAQLPGDLILDGELWEGRGLFQTTVGKIRAKAGDWSGIKFKIFDLVVDGDFENRMKRLENVILPAHCQRVDQILCSCRSSLKSFEQEILRKSGEGVMLRKSGSAYDHKRSSNLLKVKQFKSSEAVVVDYTAGSGKHEGRLGALVCEYMGKLFKIGTGLSDALRDCPPAIGSVVTFSYFETTNAGIPRFASFCAIRDYE